MNRIKSIKREMLIIKNRFKSRIIKMSRNVERRDNEKDKRRIEIKLRK